MYSWRAVRTICSVLLLLPLVHLSYLMSRETAQTMDASPEIWAQELEHYATEDANTQLPAHPIVVVGGLRVKLWGQLADLLAPKPVLMRGLGNAIVEDITFNYTELIGYYQPDTVVLLPGNSEFHLRASKSAKDLVASIRDLVKADASFGITRRFYIFTPIKTLTDPQDYPTIDEVTLQLRAWAATEPRVAILDANPLLSDQHGQPRPLYFRGDGVNLNEHGYLHLSMLLHTQVIADTPLAVGNTAPP
jgi:hypothetical protein